MVEAERFRSPTEALKAAREARELAKDLAETEQESVAVVMEFTHWPPDVYLFHLAERDLAGADLYAEKMQEAVADFKRKDYQATQDTEEGDFAS